MAAGIGLYEALLEEFDPALDKAAFAKRCGLGPDLDDWQVRFLRSESRRVIVTASRQVGKSSCSAVLALHRALHYPDSTVVIVSPSLRQSQLLFRKVIEYFEALGKPTKPDAENRLSLELPNGSMIASLPGSERTIRGFSEVDLVILDEAAACDEALWQAVIPMTLVSNGRVILASTPRGRVGKFYESWTEAEERGWERYFVPVTSVARITPEAIAAMRADMTEREYQQELECRFVETEDSAFSYASVEAAYEGITWDPF